MRSQFVCVMQSYLQRVQNFVTNIFVKHFLLAKMFQGKAARVCHGKWLQLQDIRDRQINCCSCHCCNRLGTAVSTANATKSTCEFIHMMQQLQHSKLLHMFLLCVLSCTVNRQSAGQARALYCRFTTRFWPVC